MSCACGLRAAPNGMGEPTLFPWRPACVPRRTPVRVSDLGTERATNLYCGATRPCAVNAVCRVACLEWRWRIGEHNLDPPARGEGDRSVKPSLQKRLRDGSTVAEIA